MTMKSWHLGHISEPPKNPKYGVIYNFDVTFATKATRGPGSGGGDVGGDAAAAQLDRHARTQDWRARKILFSAGTCCRLLTVDELKHT